jgi:pyridoxamine 5'-phosphate oxidase
LTESKPITIIKNTGKGATMNKEEIIALIKENPIAFLATVDGDKARVRGMDTFRADADGLIFYTGKNKNVFQQIAANPEVEVCYFTKGTQVRIRGRMEVLEDMALKKEITEKKPFLQPFYKDEASYANMAVCRLRGQATTWTMQNLAAPTTFIDF